MRKRVALLVGSPAPWDPGFEALAASPRYDFKIFYCRPAQAGMPWTVRRFSYPAEVLHHVTPPRWRHLPLISDVNPDILRRLSAFGAQAVVVHGYSTVTSLLAMGWAAAHRVPLLMRSDSNILDEQRLSPGRRALKRAVLQVLAGRLQAVVSVGTLNREYWECYGVPPQRIFHAPFAVDTRFFRERTAELRPSREAIRREAGWTRRFLVLFLGRLVPVKAVDTLVDAVRTLSSSRPDIGLLVAGDGPERNALERRAAGLDQIRFLGFQDRDRIPRLFAAADVFALPSRVEPWGVVVGEAMAAGLPVIASHRVGAARDLVIEGRTGYAVPVDDPGALAAAIDRACQGEAHLQSMGAQAMDTMQAWGADAYLEGYHRALDACFAGSQAPAGP